MLPLPSPLNTLPEADLAILEPYMHTVRFPAGTCIFRADSPGDACYIVDQGVVRIDLDRQEFQSASEIDSDTTLGYVEPGGLVGELSLLDRLPRSASAFAQSDVIARRISAADVDQLVELHPRVAWGLVAALGKDAALKVRQTNQRLAAAIFEDAPDPDVDDMVARANAAQVQIVDWPEERIDRLLSAISRTVAAHAEELAAASVAETGIGNVESKVIKNRVISLGIYAMLAGKPGIGPMLTDETSGVTEVASPVGVVFALGPLTNPVSTFTFKTLICIKSRNALILSPHRNALGVTAKVGELIRAELRTHDAPEDIVQYVAKRTNRKKTMQFMAHDGIALVLATGGSSMVKAAYSSGTPAIGVGPGNAPALICPGVDLPRVVHDILLSKTFDNGLPCGAEHNLVVVSELRDAFIAECERQGAAVLADQEAATFSTTMIDPSTRRFRGHILGQPAEHIAAEAGIRRPYPIRLIVVPATETGPDNLWAREKLAPILSLFTVPDVEQGLDLCVRLLHLDGSGHTAVIHSMDPALVERFALRMPASRILVNTPAVHGTIGMTSGLALSATLGCGTFGGNSTTDNVTYRHLLNVKRIAHFLPDAAAAWEPLLATVDGSAGNR